jgi:cytochrome P450
MKYKDYLIPAGTPVSMTSVDVHHDERIYPNSRSFIPERWLDNPKTENGSNLNRYFVAFGKGARSCLGIKYVFIPCLWNQNEWKDDC